jgi:hypothetical protein
MRSFTRKPEKGLSTQVSAFLKAMTLITSTAAITAQRAIHLTRSVRSVAVLGRDPAITDGSPTPPRGTPRHPRMR